MLTPSLRHVVTTPAGRSGPDREADHPVFGHLDPSEKVTLSPAEAEHAWAAALRAAADARRGQDPVETAAGVISALPARVIGALHQFRTVGTMHNALLLRNVCADLTHLPATPGAAVPGPPTPAVEAATLLLLAVSLLLGEPFTFQSLLDGRLVQNVVPLEGHEHTQTSFGSTTMKWHVEDGFTDDRCDYFGLLCLRGHPGAVTFLAPARRLDLTDEVAAVLREPRYVITPDAAHDLSGYPAPPPVPVLTGPATDPEICFEAIYQQPADPDDLEAVAALEALTAALNRAAIGHELRPGDLLLADNRRTVHGRTEFQPRHDGADRWLLRTMTCASIREYRRRGAIRAIG